MIKPFYQDDWTTVLCGDARAVLAEMPEHSVDVICSSPPFYNLRRYLCEPSIWDGDTLCQHVFGDVLVRRDRGTAKGATAQVGNQLKEVSGIETQQGQFCLKCKSWRGVLGMEPTPDLYIQHLVGIFDLVRKVLKPTGTIWVNLGDSYNAHSANSKIVGGFQGKAFESNQNYRDAVNSKRPRINIPDKSLIGIPARFQLAMIDKGFILRNDIAWWKRSCMPQSVKDRFTNDWEHIFMFSANPKYYFEQQFETIQSNPIYETSGKRGLIKGDVEVGDNEQRHSGNINYNPLGRNARTVWHGNEPLPIRLRQDIPKEQLDWLIKTFMEPAPEVPMGNVWDVTNSGTKYQHYAAYPTELCERPILAGCPEYLCPVCGKPREKMYQRGELVADEPGYKPRGVNSPDPIHILKIKASGYDTPTPNHHYEQTFLGYSDCGCRIDGKPIPLTDCQPGVVLDPFGGIGSTAIMAKQLGRKSIMVEISPEYAAMMVERLKAQPGVQKEMR